MNSNNNLFFNMPSHGAPTPTVTSKTNDELFLYEMGHSSVTDGPRELAKMRHIETYQPRTSKGNGQYTTSNLHPSTSPFRQVGLISSHHSNPSHQDLCSYEETVAEGRRRRRREYRLRRRLATEEMLTRLSPEQQEVAHRQYRDDRGASDLKEYQEDVIRGQNWSGRISPFCPPRGRASPQRQPVQQDRHQRYSDYPVWKEELAYKHSPLPPSLDACHKVWPALRGSCVEPDAAFTKETWKRERGMVEQVKLMVKRTRDSVPVYSYRSSMLEEERKLQFAVSREESDESTSEEKVRNRGAPKHKLNQEEILGGHPHWSEIISPFHTSRDRVPFLHQQVHQGAHRKSSQPQVREIKPGYKHTLPPSPPLASLNMRSASMESGMAATKRSFKRKRGQVRDTCPRPTSHSKGGRDSTLKESYRAGLKQEGRELQVIVCKEETGVAISVKEATLIRKELTSAIMEATVGPNREPIGPELHFRASGLVHQGWFLITCKDKVTLNWTLKWRPQSIHGIKVIRATDNPRRLRVGILLRAKNPDPEDMLAIMATQNRGLHLETWRTSSMDETRPGEWRITFLVNEMVVRQLEAANWELHYMMTTLRVQLLAGSSSRGSTKTVKPSMPGGVSSSTDRRT